MRRALVVLGLMLMAAPVWAQTGYVALSVSSSVVPSTIGPGDAGTLILSISNSGTTYAGNLKVRVYDGDYVDASNDVYMLQTIDYGSSKTVSIPIKVLDNAPSGQTTLRVDVTYSIGSGASERTEQISVPVSISGDILLKVSDVEFSEKSIEPGEMFTMNITLQNLGETSAEDISAELDLTGLPFVPVGSDVVGYISLLEPGKEKSLSYTLIVNKDADAKAYSIPLSLTYRDGAGNSYTVMRYIGVPVSGKPEFIVSVDEVKRSEAGAEVTLSIANKGTGPARYLVLTFPDYVSPRQVYIGNVDSDDYELTTVTVNPMINSFNMTLDYRNNYNQKFTEERRVIYSVPIIQRGYTEAVILVVVVLVLLWWWRRKSKK